MPRVTETYFKHLVFIRTQEENKFGKSQSYLLCWSSVILAFPHTVADLSPGAHRHSAAVFAHTYPGHIRQPRFATHESCSQAAMLATG